MLLSKISIHSWIQENNVKTETGQPLSFETLRFLFDIYSDRSPFIMSIKAAQIGFTTYEILKSAHEAYNENIDIIYVLPTADDVKQFSGGKTNRIIDNNPILQTWTNDKDSIEQKRFGKATIYYRGSWTERTALMISAKKLIVDELDRCKPEIIEQYDSRLQAITNPRKAFFSNPTLPEKGIDVYWKKSDQKKWNVTHSCGKRFVMDEDCIDYQAEVYRCPHCNLEITDEERRMGDWYDRMDNKWSGTIQTGDEWSGYWIPLWINPIFSAKKISNYKKTKTPEYFANFVAGLPYVNPNDALSEQALARCLSQETNSQNGRVIIGLDTGHNLHYTMANKEGIFYYGYCPSIAEMGGKEGYDPYDEIEKRLNDYKNSILIADQGGDLIGIRKLQAKYPGRVFLCWFTKETKTQELTRWGEHEEAGKVLADRNRVMQLVVDEINDQRLSFNGSFEDWKEFFVHALNIYRVKEMTGSSEDPQYGWRWVWKRKGPDHWFLSLIYAMIGLDRFGEELATIIKKDNFMTGVSIGSMKSGAIPAKRIIRSARYDFDTDSSSNVFD
jgi:hypothetical protein